MRIMAKIHKRFAGLMICAMLLFAMTACGTQSTQNAQKSEGISEETRDVDNGLEIAEEVQSEPTDTDEAPDIDEIIGHMSVSDKIEQMMFVSYRIWEEIAEDGFSSGVFDRIIEERHEDGKQVILVSCQLPYDAAKFEAADAVLLAYNSSVMREIPPESGAGSAYSPNLIAGLMACFGNCEVNGKTPVIVQTKE